MVPWCHGTMVDNSPQPPITDHQSLIISHQSSVTNHRSSIINHQSSIINHQSPIINPATITSHHGTKSWPRCCLADFGSRIKISAHLLRQNYEFFELDLFRLVLGCGGVVRDLGCVSASSAASTLRNLSKSQPS